ncbi:hypothetical protein [Rhizobium sp. PDO1-076]|nr:hypothetical protein [Rhizobium sp. PDO1-076]
MATFDFGATSWSRRAVHPVRDSVRSGLLGDGILPVMPFSSSHLAEQG